MVESKKPKRQPKLATAYHESGHAVAAYWLGRAFRQVTIKADQEQGSLGHVKNRKLKGSWIPDAEPDRYRIRFEKMIMISLAGAEAERLVRGRYNWQGARGDMRRADDLASYLTRGDTKEIPLYIEWLRHKTRRLVTTSYLTFAIRTLANELLSRETIPWAFARQIIRSAIRDAPLN